MTQFRVSSQNRPFASGLAPIIYPHFFPPGLSPLQPWCIISPPLQRWASYKLSVLTCIHTWYMYTAGWTGHPCLQNGRYWQLHTTMWMRVHKHRFSTSGPKRVWEVLGARERQEERQFLHHQDSRINLNRRALQHCLANSTNGLFQRARAHSHTHTHRSNQWRVPLSFASLTRSPEWSKKHQTGLFKQLPLLFVTGSLSGNICRGKQVVLRIQDQSQTWWQTRWTSQHLPHRGIRAVSPKSKLFQSNIIFLDLKNCLEILVVCRGQVMWKTFCRPRVSWQRFQGACAVMIAQKLPKLISFNLGNCGLFSVTVAAKKLTGVTFSHCNTRSGCSPALRMHRSNSGISRYLDNVEKCVSGRPSSIFHCFRDVCFVFSVCLLPTMLEHLFFRKFNFFGRCFICFQVIFLNKYCKLSQHLDKKKKSYFTDKHPTDALTTFDNTGDILQHFSAPSQQTQSSTLP